MQILHFTIEDYPSLVAIHNSLGVVWPERPHTPPAQVRWREALNAIVLGLAITMIQLVYFNDPTIVVR